MLAKLNWISSNRARIRMFFDIVLAVFYLAVTIFIIVALGKLFKKAAEFFLEKEDSAVHSAAKSKQESPERSNYQAGDSKNSIEREFNNVFFTRTEADKERMIAHWMKRLGVDRPGAMKSAVDDWRIQNRSYRSH